MSNEEPPGEGRIGAHREGKSQHKRWKAPARKLSALAGGAGAIWMGIVFLLELGWGIGLTGIGMILLIEQLARRRFGLDHDLYWTAAGALALIGGMLLESGHDLRIGPVILILIGILAIISAVSRREDARRENAHGDRDPSGREVVS